MVTGATGFVGTALIARLIGEERFGVRGTVRRESAELPAGVERVLVGELTADTDWLQALAGVNTAVHLAARVHVMREVATDPLVEFRRANVAGTLNLARQAAAAGVRRFVFLSSVKVNGESGAYSEADAPAPEDAYGISKYEAELGLRQIAAETGIEVVIIRPPLIYGPGVKANFLNLIQLIERDIPLPLGGIRNQRSLLGLTNLVDLICCCLEHPAAAGETFLVSDGDEVSTPELVRRIARALGKSALLLSVPEWMIKLGGTVIGKSNQVKRLCGSLQINSSKVRRVLGWAPQCSMAEELARVAAWRSACVKTRTSW